MPIAHTQLRATPSSCNASRKIRSTSGSPQPGHMWCSSVRRSSGFTASTTRAGRVGGAEVSRIGPEGVAARVMSDPPFVVGYRRQLRVGAAAVHGEDPLADDLG